MDRQQRARICPESRPDQPTFVVEDLIYNGESQTCHVTCTTSGSLNERKVLSQPANGCAKQDEDNGVQRSLGAVECTGPMGHRTKKRVSSSNNTPAVEAGRWGQRFKQSGIVLYPKSAPELSTKASTLSMAARDCSRLTLNCGTRR